MKTIKSILLAVLFCSLLISCDNNNDDSQIVCTEEFAYGLSVTVRDTNTNEILIDGITVVAEEGAYSENLMTIEGIDNFFGAGERAGNYIVTVSGEGYKTVVSEAIEVSENECHVIPESIEISLTPN